MNLIVMQTIQWTKRSNKSTEAGYRASTTPLSSLRYLTIQRHASTGLSAQPFLQLEILGMK